MLKRISCQHLRVVLLIHALCFYVESRLSSLSGLWIVLSRAHSDGVQCSLSFVQNRSVTVLASSTFTPAYKCQSVPQCQYPVYNSYILPPVVDVLPVVPGTTVQLVSNAVAPELSILYCYSTPSINVVLGVLVMCTLSYRPKTCLPAARAPSAPRTCLYQ